MTTKESPIIFSGPMVRAILEGKKTQTRRVAKEFNDMHNLDGILARYPNQEGCPYGKPGDRLWVRETWRVCGGREYEYLREQNQVMYRSTHEKDGFPLTWESYKWRPSTHMPRWASRITLEITGVRVERLQQISEEDARAEGITDGGCLSCGNPEPCGCNDPRPDARDAFAWLWQSIHGSRSWHANPWVWVIEYRLEAAK